MFSPLLFTIVLEALSGKIRSEYQEKSFYADDVILISESLGGLKGKLESSYYWSQKGYE